MDAEAPIQRRRLVLGLGGAGWRRTRHGVITLMGTSVLVFIMVRVVPGDPAELLSSDFLDEAYIERQREALGLDRSMFVQYVLWLRHAAVGDFGLSFRFNRPATEVILERLPATLELAMWAMLFAVLAGLLIGIVAALKSGSAIDGFLTLSANVFQGIPPFFLGIVLILIFAVSWDLFPTSGRQGLESVVLPACTLGLWLVGPIARLTRTSMIDSLNAHHVITAEARGLPRWRVIVFHVLRPALLPLVTFLGIQMGTLLAGAIVVEAVFAWPGIGTVLVSSIVQRDYPIVQAAVLYSAIAYVVVNMGIEWLYTKIDPRAAADGA